MLKKIVTSLMAMAVVLALIAPDFARADKASRQHRRETRRAARQERRASRQMAKCVGGNDNACKRAKKNAVKASRNEALANGKQGKEVWDAELKRGKDADTFIQQARPTPTPSPTSTGVSGW